MNLLSPSWSSSFQPGTDPSCNFNVTSTASAVNLYHNPVTVTASGGLTATVCGGFAGSCSPGSITSVTASGTNQITVTDDGGHTGTITLSGFTASGGLTATQCGGFGGSCGPGVITEVTASGNTITIKDSGGHTGTMTLSGATASGGLTACDPSFAGCANGSSIYSVVAQSNTIGLQDHGGHHGYIMLSR